MWKLLLTLPHLTLPVASQPPSLDPDFFWDAICATIRPLSHLDNCNTLLPEFPALRLAPLSLDCRAHDDHPTFMLQTLQLLFLGRFRSFRSLTYRILPSASPSSFLVLLCFTCMEFLHFFTEPRPLHSKPLHTVSPLPQTFLCPFRFLGKQCFS